MFRLRLQGAKMLRIAIQYSYCHAIFTVNFPTQRFFHSRKSPLY